MQLGIFTVDVSDLMFTNAEHNCPQVKGEHIRQIWERSFSEYFNGSPLEKAFTWEHLLTEDIVIVQSALSTCKVLCKDIHTKRRQQFLEKLASIIPNSHSRNVILQFYVEILIIYQDSSELLVKLVKFYPLAVTSINMLLRKFFINYLEKNPNKGEHDSEIIVWSKDYFIHLFESKDLFSATTTLNWMSQFHYRSVHEFLLSTASNLIPQVSKPEYWLFLYNLLQIVVPGPPPTLISSNRYASVLFSVAASVSPGSPITPEQFLLELCQQASNKIIPTPILYSHISLTPGLVGLAAYVMTRYPTPSILPFIKKTVDIKQGASVHLFGCFIYPLSILGGINDFEVKKEVSDIMCKILNMDPCPPEQKDYISRDDYSDKCIKTEESLISLKLGQVLSHIAETGLSLVEKQLQKSKLTTFSAIVLCHSIIVSEDRPSDLLLSTFRLSDDSTNLSILTFLIVHMKLIRENKVKQSLKFYNLYVKNLCLLVKNASNIVLKKMIKMIFSDGGPFDDEKIHSFCYQVMYEIWEDHGGLVYNTFYSMLFKPKFPHQDLVIIQIIRRVCSSNRPTDVDDIQKIIFRYMNFSSDSKVISMCIDSLTYLCINGLDFRQIHYNIISQYVSDTQLALSLCFFYSEFVVNCQQPDLLDDIVNKLWDFTLSHDIEVSSLAYNGLLKSEIEFNISAEKFKQMLIIHKNEYPDFAAEFISSIICRELQNFPVQEIGNIPNPSKKLVTEFRVNFKNLSCENNLTHVLFSFSAISSSAGRQKHKQKLQENERIFSLILNKYSDDLFHDPFHGIIIIESWNHFMFAYMTSIINLPSYQRKNRGDISSNSIILDQLLQIKQDVSSFIDKELQKSNKMYLLVLTTTSITLSVYKIAQKYEIALENIKPVLKKDIGILRTLTAYNCTASNKAVKTNAILLLCSAYVAKIACHIGDESLLQMLLNACTTNIPKEYSHDLVSQCASVATGVIIHVYYKIKPKTSCIKDAMQILLDSNQYLGLSFCIDSLSNSIQKPAVRKFIDDFTYEATNKMMVAPDKILFIGLLLAFSFHVDNADEQELLEFFALLGEKIDAALTEVEQKYYLMIQGLIYYNLSNWQYCRPSWKCAYQNTIEKYVSKFKDGFGSIPTLSLLIGFPITNLVDFFDWGPTVELVCMFSNMISKNMQYGEGRLCALIVARKCESEHKSNLIKYKNLSSDSVWELFNDEIQSSLSDQTYENKQKLRFALQILCHTTCKIPLDNPLQTMVNIFTRTTLQHEVIRCAGIHAKKSSEYFYKFIEKYMSLSVYPQLSLQCQIEIISQIPNFIQFVPKLKIDHLFSNFLCETFWQGNKELRLKILEVLQLLYKTQPSIRQCIHNSLVCNYFRHTNIHLLTPTTILEIGQLMKIVDFYQLELSNLVAECHLVIDFIKSRYHMKDVVDLFFTRYLQAELYTPELLRAVVNVILLLDNDLAYNSLYKVMFHIKKALLENPGPENFINPAIACINTVILTYVAYLKDKKSIGNGLEHFLYLSELVEPQVNVDCLHVVLSTIEPWFQINRLYDDVLPNE